MLAALKQNQEERAAIMSKEMMRQQPFDGEHGSSSFSLTQSPTEPTLPIMQAIKPTDTTDMYNNLGSDGETGTS